MTGWRITQDSGIYFVVSGNDGALNENESFVLIENAEDRCAVLNGVWLRHHDGHIHAWRDMIRLPYHANQYEPGSTLSEAWDQGVDDVVEGVDRDVRCGPRWIPYYEGWNSQREHEGKTAA